jgi:hypothetical protein
MKNRIITLCIGFLLVHAYIWGAKIVNAQTVFNRMFDGLSLNANMIRFSGSYDISKMTFALPVADEAFQRDLTTTVVIYKGEEESLVFNNALLRFQTTVAPTSWMNAEVAYMPKFDQEPSLSDGFYTRQEVYGIETTMNLGESWELNTEYAMSQSHTEAKTDTEQSQAFQINLNGTVGEQFEIHGSYQVAEGDFLTFANPDFAPDEKQIELSGTYFYRPEHSLTFGYSFLQDSLPWDSENPTTTTHSPFVEWYARVREHTELFLTYEYSRETDDQSPKVNDEHTHTFLIGGIQEFLQVPLLKTFVLSGEYQLDAFEDTTDQTMNTQTHQVKLWGNAEPVEGITTYAAQREWVVHDKDLKKSTERQDISTVGMELNRWERLSTQTQYQYQVAYDLLRDERESEGQTVTLSSQYTPLSVVTTSGKLTLRDETFFLADTENGQTSLKMLNLKGHVCYMPTQDLTIQVRYDYGQDKDRADTTSTIRGDTAEFRINYAFDTLKTRLTGAITFERTLRETPPTSKTETRTLTYQGRAAWQLTDRWDAMAQYKRETRGLAVDTVHTNILGEIGYSAGRFLKFVTGYQYIAFTDHSEPMNTYTANLMYVKLIGKL